MGDAVPSRDHYATLGIEGSATADEIRRAFRALAARYHPDKNPGDKGAATRFKRINAAYQVLSDEGKRAEYDRLTRPIDDEDEVPPRVPDPPKAKPKPSGPKKRTTTEARPDPKYEPERELLRDNYVVVTTRRVMFPGDRSYAVEKILGVHFVHHGRDLMLVVGGLGLLFGAILVGADDHLRAGTTLGVMGGSAVVRFFSRSPMYSARLILAGGNADSPASPNAGWARDIVRAVESVARVRAAAVSTSNAIAETLGGAMASFVAVAVCWTVAAQFETKKPTPPEPVVTAATYPAVTAPAETATAVSQSRPTRPAKGPVLRAASARPQGPASTARPASDPCGGDARCRCAAKSGCPECVKTCQANSSSGVDACIRYCLTDTAVDGETVVAPPSGKGGAPSAGEIERAAPF
jgi:hypothetical protein